jgi:hypothetical protein
MVRISSQQDKKPILP